MPRRFSPTGSYSERQLTRAVGYRVLAHAEFEAYLEERASEVALAALSAWKLTGAVGRTLILLSAFCERERGAIPKSLAAPQQTQVAKWPDRIEVSRRIDIAAEWFFGEVKSNHGIKESNILQLLLPIGFPTGSLDATWLANMNSFGESRGLAAHSSRVRQQLDPHQELNTVQALLAHLRHVDEELNKLVV